MKDKRKKFIQNNWRWIIGICLSFLAVLIPAWFSISQNKTKSLDIKINNITPLIENGSGDLEDIVITYGGVKIDNPYSSVIEISNSGNLPIEKQDYEKPIEITVGKNTNVIKANISETIPKGISSNVTFDKNKILVHSALLNPEDKVVIDVLTGTGSPAFAASGRISGIKSVSVTGKSNKKTKIIMEVLLVISALISLTACVVVFDASDEKIVLNKKSSWFVSITLINAFSLSMIFFLENLGFNNFWYYFIFYIVAVCISMPLGFHINRSAQQSA